MRMLTETHVYMQRHQGAKVEHFDVSNVIYHKFSHVAVSYTLNGENVNVMLQSYFSVNFLDRLEPTRCKSRDNLQFWKYRLLPYFIIKRGSHLLAYIIMLNKH